MLIFDSNIKQFLRSIFYHLSNIANIQHFLSQKGAEEIVHAFLTSAPDHCNFRLSDSAINCLKTLQLIQVAAAGALIGTRESHHISPVSLSLHRLPVKTRIQNPFLTYKALTVLAASYLNALMVLQCRTVGKLL